MSPLHQAIQQLTSSIEAANPSNPKEVELYRQQYLGRSGEIQKLFEDFKLVAPEEKKSIGKVLNDLKNLAEAKYVSLKESITEETASDDIDLTLPIIPNKLGNLHPLTLTRYRIIEIFERLGFNVEDGPEIEDDWHNFSALNFPENHPAREMQDTFFIQRNPDVLLRTHTSNVQIRLLNKKKPPVRAIMPGRVYRNEIGRAHV